MVIYDSQSLFAVGSLLHFIFYLNQPFRNVLKNMHSKHHIKHNTSNKVSCFAFVLSPGTHWACEHYEKMKINHKNRSIALHFFPFAARENTIER